MYLRNLHISVEKLSLSRRTQSSFSVVFIHISEHTHETYFWIHHTYFWTHHAYFWTHHTYVWTHHTCFSTHHTYFWTHRRVTDLVVVLSFVVTHLWTQYIYINSKSKIPPSLSLLWYTFVSSIFLHQFWVENPTIVVSIVIHICELNNSESKNPPSFSLLLIHICELNISTSILSRRIPRRLCLSFSW